MKTKQQCWCEMSIEMSVVHLTLNAFNMKWTSSNKVFVGIENDIFKLKIILWGFLF